MTTQTIQPKAAQPYGKPLPSPDTDTAGFWEGARAHELRIKQCTDCKKFRFPPDPMCPYCGSWNQAWTAVSGRGRVNSFVIIHQMFASSFAKDLPYAVIQIAIDEQPDVLLTSNIVDCKNEDITVGMPLEAVFSDVADDVTLVLWRPAK